MIILINFLKNCQHQISHFSFFEFMPFHHQKLEYSGTIQCQPGEKNKLDETLEQLEYMASIAFEQNQK